MASDLHSRERILLLLKQRGALSAAELAEALAITPMGTRQHLAILAEDGLVESRNQRRSVGRPAQLWSLTGLAHQRFADAHGELVLELVEAARRSFGEVGVEQLLATRRTEQLARYRDRIPADAELAERAKALCQLRSEEGYMADCWADGDDVLLAENHCPICEAAKGCPGLCANEWELFRAALGDDVQVDRVEHVLEGDRRCLYRLSMRGSAA